MDEIDELVKQLASGKISAEEFQRRGDEIAKRNGAAAKAAYVQSSNNSAEDILAKSILRKLKAI